MPIAAVPGYLGQDFTAASPAMRFGIYLKLWGTNSRTNTLRWETYDIDYEVRGQNQMEREVRKENKVSALRDARRLNDDDKKAMHALLVRQRQTFETVGAINAVFRLDAESVAPFTTGLGNEHPLENGFSFLNPYGLPYLPGSGIKGVLRQATWELASGKWGESCSWNEDDIAALFGLQPKDGDTEHSRGALIFWDVIPQIKGDSLMVEIMTPHQNHYYQQDHTKGMGSSTPHDSGQPMPISYLTVPPGSGFTFHVGCDLALLRRIAPTLAENNRWEALLTTAFEHAFQWLGFGAKTSVGYGAMRALSLEEVEQADADAKAATLHCGWVDETIKRLTKTHNAKALDVLRGKPLAEEWRALQDRSLQVKAFADIKARWQAQGWWNNPPGKSAKQARVMYEGSE